MTEEAWREIESAPRDGTRVLLWTDTDNEEDRDYIDVVCEGEHVQIVQIGYWSGDYWEKEIIGSPTYWQPLPAPPTNTKGE